MRPRDLRPDEMDEMRLRRARLREVLQDLRADWNPGAAAVAAAPYLDRWETARYPGTDRPCLDLAVSGRAASEQVRLKSGRSTIDPTRSSPLRAALLESSRPSAVQPLCIRLTERRSQG